MEYDVGVRLDMIEAKLNALMEAFEKIYGKDLKSEEREEEVTLK